MLDWKPIDESAQDGRVVFICDSEFFPETLTLAFWSDDTGWMAEYDEIIDFSPTHYSEIGEAL